MRRTAEDSRYPGMSLGTCHLISRIAPAHFTVNLHVDYLGTFGHFYAK